VLEPIVDGDKGKDYLATYVNPTLLHGLSALCRHKPAQPIVRSLSHYTRWSIKTGHYIRGDNFVICEPIFTIFALLRRQLNFPNQTHVIFFRLTVTLVPHYLGKFIILIYLKKTTACAHSTLRSMSEYVVCK